MNNLQLIANAALEHGVFSELEIAEFIDQGYIPLHCKSEWDKIGAEKGVIYKIKDGEKGITCSIWKAKNTQNGKPSFYKAKCCFYKEEQLIKEKATLDM